MRQNMRQNLRPAPPTDLPSMTADDSAATPHAGPARRLDAARVQQMLQTMLSLQEGHNLIIAEDWRTRGLPFHRAIWVECAELLDHFGWKWWKKQSPDLGQVHLEIVDIWHFGLSCLMLQGDDLGAVAAHFAALPQSSSGTGTATDAAATPDPEAFRRNVEQLARAALDTEFSVPRFIAVLQSLPMDFVTLFELYVGKNVLNRFRQANGYASGTYRKLWDGREDNVHLLELAATLPADHPDYITALHDALGERYRAAANAAQPHGSDDAARSSAP
jgi:hypothetical protein